MTLGDFIKEFIAPNTLIRLWQPISKDDPEYEEHISHKLYSVNGKRLNMSWELERDPIVSFIPVKHVTDIFMRRLCRSSKHCS